MVPHVTQLLPHAQLPEQTTQQPVDPSLHDGAASNEAMTRIVIESAAANAINR
jgi:hypothetical protein